MAKVFFTLFLSGFLFIPAAGYGQTEAETGSPEKEALEAEEGQTEAEGEEDWWEDWEEGEEWGKVEGTKKGEEKSIDEVSNESPLRPVDNPKEVPAAVKK